MGKRILITGISGFIAHHCAVEFLNNGYNVRGTVRSLSKAADVKEALSDHVDVSNLEFVEADLTSDDGWDEAVKGCDYVAHLASPFPLNQPKDENDLIMPAVDGTLRVLNAAARAGVKRFIQTSSTVAIAYGHEHNRAEPFTEADWSNLDSPGSTAYAKSKILAERAARSFMEKSDGKMSFASVNPGFVLGPIIGKDYGSSGDLIQMMMNGKYPGTPRISMFYVDVRDVAKCHRLALEYEGEMDRFMAVEKSMWFVELAKALKSGIGARAKRVPNRDLPNFLVRIVALFDAGVRAILPELGNHIRTDSSATQKELGITFRSSEEAVVAMGQSLIDRGVIK